ncbi:MAG: DUF3426 domain-containing protein [Pseudomonadota bacterium]
MYTKCPECDAIFRVTTEQLNIADGLVRCGICDTVFNGREHIEEGHDPRPTQEETNEPDSESWQQEESEDYALDVNENQADEDALIDADVIPTVIKDDFGGNPLTKSNSPIHIAVFTIGAIALALFFLGQITYWQNVDILPRSWVNTFCKPFNCGDENKRDLAAIKILNRNIYTHPNVDKALMITTSFVNQAQNAQLFPLLQISLLDTQGQLIAVRRFSPKDYLVDKSLLDTLMQPNQPVGARLEVQDPGNTVIAYEFEFY